MRVKQRANPAASFAAKKTKFLKARVPSQTRVFLVDSCQVYRDGLIQAIRKNKTIEIAGAVAFPGEVFTALPQEVDVILLDMDWPETESLKLLLELVHSFSCAILPLSYREREIDLVVAHALQCPGWLVRRLEPASLVNAIQFAPRTPVFSADQLRRIHNWKKTVGAQLFDLRSRELEPLWLVMQGKSNAEIARVMSLSEHTVEKYVSTLIHKFEQPSRTALILHLLKNNLDALQYFSFEILELIAAA